MMVEDEEALNRDDETAVAAMERPVVTAIAHPRHQPEPPAPKVVHPPAYRNVVAGWSEDWRERWGRRANELEDSGLSWRDAEAQAFAEVWNLLRRSSNDAFLHPTESDPERN